MRTAEFLRPQVMPGSLYPSMVRGGIVMHRNGVKLPNGVLADMPSSSTGHLLLPPSITEITHQAELNYLKQMGALGWRGAHAYADADMDHETGCLPVNVSTLRAI